MATGLIPKYMDGTDTGWKNLQEASAFTGTIKYRKCGNIFEITTHGWITISGQLSLGGSYWLADIPSEDRPGHVVIGMVFVNDLPYPLILLKVESGAVRVYNGSSQAYPSGTKLMINGMIFDD